MVKNPVKPPHNMKKDPKEGISFLFTDDNVLHIQKARRLTKKELIGRDKSKQFMLDELRIVFNSSADAEYRPKLIFSNRKYV